MFHLIRRKIVNETDLDGPEPADCSRMNLRDLGISIYDNLLVKSVSFNGTSMGYFTRPSAVDPASMWVYVDLFKTLDDFSEESPVDVVITVRGRVDALCPATEFLHSSAACEFAMHGRYNTTQCCPHGATKRQGPPDDCCVDDVEKAPYRMQYLRSNVDDEETVFDFAVKVVTVSGVDFDLEEPAACDHMTLDYAQIQIYQHMEVLEVKWEERIMPFNITPATDYSKWLNINGINRFVTDFDPAQPTRFAVKVRGYVREPCPAAWLFDAGGAVMCEYSLHGTQGQHTCCPHHITEIGSLPEDCGCRDDVTETPYRLGYSPVALSSNQTVFSFDLAAVDPSASADFDGKPDINKAAEVGCAAMELKSLSFAVHTDLQVQQVMFNGFSYSWQTEPYTPTAKWLKILDIDYRPGDFLPGESVPLLILVNGVKREMCPASALTGSQASCEYLLYGLDSYAECCPHGVTSWLTPAMLAVSG